jgi:hypothetical protein
MPERDDFSSNRHPALSFCLSMIFFGKPVPTFPDHALGRWIDRSPSRGEAAAVDYGQLGKPDTRHAGSDSLTQPRSHPVDAQKERPMLRTTDAFTGPAS